MAAFFVSPTGEIHTSSTEADRSALAAAFTHGAATVAQSRPALVRSLDAAGRLALAYRRAFASLPANLQWLAAASARRSKGGAS